MKSKNKHNLKLLFLNQFKKYFLMAEYMKKNKVGFNEVVRRLSTSPSQAAKIQRGEANLTLASFANLAP